MLNRVELCRAVCAHPSAVESWPSFQFCSQLDWINSQHVQFWIVRSHPSSTSCEFNTHRRADATQLSSWVASTVIGHPFHSTYVVVKSHESSLKVTSPQIILVAREVFQKVGGTYPWGNLSICRGWSHTARTPGQRKSDEWCARRADGL